MAINMVTVDSTSIFEIGYLRRTLMVKFNSGRIYEFKKVPRAVFDLFMKSKSKGQFFNENVKALYQEKEV